MNIGEDVFEAIKNSIEGLEYDFEHDEKLFINQLADGPTTPGSGSKQGSPLGSDPSPQGQLAIKDDDQYPPEVLLAATHTSELD